MGSEQPLDVTIPGFAEVGDAASRPGVDADNAGGAWLTWMKYSAGGLFTRAAAHVLESGEVDQSFIFPRTSGLVSPAVGTISPSHVWIADTDGQTVMVGEYQDGALSALRDILVAPAAPDSGPRWTPQDFAAVDGKDERWLAFTEASDLLHVVRIAEGCTYQSALYLAVY